MWLKNKINQYRIRRREKRQYNAFLAYGTNVALKDNLNALCSRKEKPLYVLGNGDSLRASLQQLSKDNDYMVVNSAVLSPSYKKLKPRYYTLADPGYFFENKAFEGPSVVRRILEETTWPMLLFVPYMHSRKAEWLKSTKYVTVIKVNQSLYTGPELYREYCYDHNLAIPSVQNVLVACIYEGICLGYDRIDLYGFEHSWTKSLYVGEDNHVYLRDSHFYEDNVKDTIQIKTNGEPLKIHEMLMDYAQMFESYWEIRKFADRKEVQIVNCTPNSFIDAFERIIRND